MSAFRDTTITVNGAKIALRRGGAGAPLLYLHGANGVPGVLPFMEQLAQRFDVLVPEHPGFGRSDEPNWVETIHDVAYFYLDFLEQLGLDGTHVVGTSLGGWIAMEIAVRNQSRLRSLTLAAPAGILVPTHPPADIFLMKPEESVRALFHDQAFAERMLAIPLTPELAELQVKNKFATARLAWDPRLHDPTLARWLHRVKIPTQIIWGDADKIFAPVYAQTLKQHIPHAAVTILEQCGHLAHIEKTERFVRLITDFAAKA